MAAVEIDPSDTQYGLDCAFNLIRDDRRLEALRICDLLCSRIAEYPLLRDALGSASTDPDELCAYT
jgi:hypothetical protein